MPADFCIDTLLLPRLIEILSEAWAGIVKTSGAIANANKPNDVADATETG